MASLNRTSWQIGTLSAAALMLAACGGGGGDGGDSPGNNSDDLDTTSASEIEINTENGESIGRNAASGASQLGNSGAQLTQSQVVGAADLSGGGSALGVAAATHLAVREALALADNSADTVAGATTSYNCDEGSAEITENDNGSPDELDAGDSWTATWSSCTFGSSFDGQSFSFTLDGSIEYDVTSCDALCVGSDAEDWGYSLSITYTDWSVTSTQNSTTTVDILADGTLNLGADNDTGLGETTFTIGGGPFVFRDRQSGAGFGYGQIDIVHVLDNSTQAYETTVNAMEFTSTQTSGKVSAMTTTGNPLTGTDSFPTDGNLVIMGANSTSAEVDAGACGPDQFRLFIGNADQGCKPWETSN